MWSFAEIENCAAFMRQQHFVKEIRVSPLRTEKKAEVMIQIYLLKGDKTFLHSLYFKVADPGKQTTPRTTKFVPNIGYLETPEGFNARSWVLSEVYFGGARCSYPAPKSKKTTSHPFTVTMMELRLLAPESNSFEVETEV